MPGSDGGYEALCPECGEVCRMRSAGPIKCDCGYDSGKAFMDGIDPDGKARNAAANAMKHLFGGR